MERYGTSIFRSKVYGSEYIGEQSTDPTYTTSLPRPVAPLARAVAPSTAIMTTRAAYALPQPAPAPRRSEPDSILGKSIFRGPVIVGEGVEEQSIDPTFTPSVMSFPSAPEPSRGGGCSPCRGRWQGEGTFSLGDSDTLTAGLVGLAAVILVPVAVVGGIVAMAFYLDKKEFGKARPNRRRAKKRRVDAFVHVCPDCRGTGWSSQRDRECEFCAGHGRVSREMSTMSKAKPNKRRQRHAKGSPRLRLHDPAPRLRRRARRNASRGSYHVARVRTAGGDIYHVMYSTDHPGAPDLFVPGFARMKSKADAVRAAKHISKEKGLPYKGVVAHDLRK